ncbi:MAG TPA: hypothetical protein EYO75_07740 [Sulfurimonas sp.]|nr:hypothetical protein [Sulfurimonas sp.]HIM74838.1 hypothetical protein [Campylobacterales bacterium]
MIKISLLIMVSILFSGCVNKHGISAKYYSDCKEYYDLQGYYHKECGKDDIITYKEIGEALKKKKPEPTENVY